jgi:hypothetical protein
MGRWTITLVLVLVSHLRWVTSELTQTQTQQILAVFNQVSEFSSEWDILEKRLTRPPCFRPDPVRLFLQLI